MFAIVLTIALAAPNAPTADEPTIVATLTTLSAKDKPKVKFWYGEPIRFQVEFSTTSKDARSFRIQGAQTPLYPVGEGLVFKHKDGDSYRVELTPAFHLTPAREVFEVSSEKSVKKSFEFPDYESDGGTSRMMLLFEIPEKETVEPDLKERIALKEKRWKKGIGLLPPGEFTVTFRREVIVGVGENAKRVLVESKPVKIEVHEDQGRP
jgi:hypothetical protein